MTDLDKMIAAVEAGLPSPTNWRNFIALTGEDVDETPFAILAHRSYHGDLNAALRLHEALLPGWDYRLGRDGGDFHALVFVSGRLHEHSGDWEMCPDSTARAWFLAILRAIKAKGDVP